MSATPRPQPRLCGVHHVKLPVMTSRPAAMVCRQAVANSLARLWLRLQERVPVMRGRQKCCQAARLAVGASGAGRCA
jgi:hypothetical protein